MTFFFLEAIMFFIWVPGELISWTFAGPVLIGVLVTMIIGEILLYISGRQKRVN